MNKILSRVSVGTAAVITAATGLTGVVGAAPYHGSHHHPVNTYWGKTLDITTLKNKANLDVTNDNHQVASSGRVEAEDNHSVGSVSSGAATNNNSFSASVSVDNSSSSKAALAPAADPEAPSLSTPYHASVSNVTKTYVTNHTDIDLTNTNTQTATTGSVEVEDNGSVGSVSSGAATNTNSSNVSLSITN